MTSLKSVRLQDIREVWESFTGWYWFVTEYHEGTMAFGLVRGWEIEWGYFDLAELHELKRTLKVWRVPRKNWAVCPCVETDAVSYSWKTRTANPQTSLGKEQLKGGGLTMETNEKLNLDETAQDVERRDSIMLCATKAGNGYKVVHNGIWYYASRVRVLDVVNRKQANCLFVPIEDDVPPIKKE